MAGEHGKPGLLSGGDGGSGGDAMSTENKNVNNR